MKSRRLATFAFSIWWAKFAKSLIFKKCIHFCTKVLRHTNAWKIDSNLIRTLEVSILNNSLIISGYQGCLVSPICWSYIDIKGLLYLTISWSYPDIRDTWPLRFVDLESISKLLSISWSYLDIRGAWSGKSVHQS